MDPKAVHRSETNLTVAQTANPKAMTQPERHNYYAMHKFRSMFYLDPN